MADLLVLIGSILILLTVWFSLAYFAYHRSPAWSLRLREQRIRRRHRG